MNDHLHRAVSGLLSRAERLVARARQETADPLLDLALSAVYPARGAAELLREASEEKRIAPRLSDLDTLFDEHVPNWRLIWAVRIQDFHRSGLSPDPENPYGLLATIPAQSTVALHLNVEPPRARLVAGGAEAARDVFLWAPPFVQVGADTDPVPILDALESYLAGMRTLIAHIRSAA